MSPAEAGNEARRSRRGPGLEVWNDWPGERVGNDIPLRSCLGRWHGAFRRMSRFEDEFQTFRCSCVICSSLDASTCGGTPWSAFCAASNRRFCQAQPMGKERSILFGVVPRRSVASGAVADVPCHLIEQLVDLEGLGKPVVGANLRRPALRVLGGRHDDHPDVVPIGGTE